MSDDIAKLVREIVRREFASLSMGKIQSVQAGYRATATRFSGTDPGTPNQRLIQPFGMASTPPDGTECVIAPIGANPTHLVNLGQNDTGRPATNSGESILYGANGQVIYCKNDGTIRQGVKTAASPIVLGDVQVNFWNDFLAIFTDTENEFAECAVGDVYVSPAVVAKIELFIEKYLTNPATNIVGQKNFVDRGAE